MEAEDGYRVRLDALRQTLARNRIEIAKLNKENQQLRKTLQVIRDWEICEFAARYLAQQVLDK